MHVHDTIYKFLPVTTPANEEHEACGPDDGVLSLRHVRTLCMDLKCQANLEVQSSEVNLIVYTKIHLSGLIQNSLHYLWKSLSRTMNIRE